MIWKCLPEIAPQGHFLALRAQGATAPLGPRNDKSESFTPQNAYRKSCQSAWRSASALYRGIKPQEGTGAPRAPLTCHCEERSDVAISQYPAASWESYRRKRNCLPEIAPQGHFLALRAQGATAPLGPRNDKAGGFPHSSFFSLQDSFISVPLPCNTRLTALQNFPLSIFDFPRSPILFFSVFLYKYFRIESAKIRKKINKVRKYP